MTLLDRITGPFWLWGPVALWYLAWECFYFTRLFFYYRAVKARSREETSAFERAVVVPGLSWLFLPNLIDWVGVSFSMEFYLISLLIHTILLLTKKGADTAAGTADLPLKEYLGHLERIRWTGFLPWLVWAIWNPDAFWRQALHRLDPPLSYFVSGLILTLIVILTLSPSVISKPLDPFASALLRRTEPPGWLLPALASILATALIYLVLFLPPRYQFLTWLLGPGLLAPIMGMVFRARIKETTARTMAVWAAATTTLGILFVCASLLGPAVQGLTILALILFVFSWMRSAQSPPSPESARERAQEESRTKR